MRYRYIPQGSIRHAYDCGVHFHYDRAEAERCWWWRNHHDWLLWPYYALPSENTLRAATWANFDGQDVRLVLRYLRALAKK